MERDQSASNEQNLEFQDEYNIKPGEASERRAYMLNHQQTLDTQHLIRPVSPEPKIVSNPSSDSLHGAGPSPLFSETLEQVSLNASSKLDQSFKQDSLQD